MSTSSRRLRNLWRDIHLWLGIGFCLLAVPVGISGSLLVWHDGIEEILAPQRHATTGETLGVPLVDMIEAAKARSGEGAVLTRVALPTGAGDPVEVMLRPADAANPRATVSIWFDPPTGAVLDEGPSANAFMRLMHDLHGNLLVPQFSGRQIVGWVGVAMLVLSLSGIYLWWPRRLSLARALGWRKNMRPTANLHHMFGIWIAIPLAVLSLTGMYLSFPQTSRAVLGAFVDMPEGGPRGPGGRPRGAVEMLAETALTPDQALAAGLAAAAPEARAVTLTPPSRQTPEWRITLTGVETPSVTVADATGVAALQAPPPPAAQGDVVRRWIRWIHDGNNTGPIWQAVIFVGGLLPLLFAITGIMMWLRRRKAEKALAAKRAAALAASN